MTRKPHRQGTKPADPALQEGREKDRLRPFGVPRWVGILIYSLFWFILLIPLVRRWRRSPRWVWVRAALTALSAAAFYSAYQSGSPASALGAAVLLGAAALLGPTADPDAERKLQRRYGADYMLNGGWLDGCAVCLLIRDRELLLVDPNADEAPIAVYEIDQVESIRVDGETYRPVYVSEAKDPPTQAAQPLERSNAVDLDITFRAGDSLLLTYRGVFSRHLAETAAHAVNSVRVRSADLPVLAG